MTKRRLFIWVGLTILFFILCAGFGVLLKTRYPAVDDPVYSTFQDLIPFLIAAPAAWLGYCFSRRIVYLE